jgi:ribonuclease E
MVTRMLIDAAHPEETRVAVVKGNRLEEFDFETSTKKTLKGNIYLAKVTRVEPSLQAAFVDYGGNRHGFLPFGEIHPDYYQIPVADRRALLASEAAEELRAAEAEDAGEKSQTPMERPERPGDQGHGENVESQSSGEGQGENDAEGDGAPATDENGDHNHPNSAGESAEEQARSADGEGEAQAQSENQSEKESQDNNGNGAQQDSDVESLGGDALDEVQRPRRVHVRQYRIQEVIKRRQILLIQVVKEERGTKGAALTTYMSLAGRYCVLMPNTARGGGISRKIVSAIDRKRLKSIATDLEVPEGMGVIVRTAGMERSKAEIKRDFEFLLRSWDIIRESTLKSTAPCLIYEDANLIKRAIRDLYTKDIDEVLVEGDDGYRAAKDFMRMLMPSHAKRVQPHRDRVPIFQRFQIEHQLDSMYSPVVPLKSGGSVVLGQTEALVAIDVNSGKSTREHNIEETAYKTNLEAAEEIARQLRLRDLAGLVVIDFIDMEVQRNVRSVERRLKECLKADRARIQIGRISPFGLLEMSRQRLRPSLIEASTQLCERCHGRGYVRSTESTALHVLRGIEDEGLRGRNAEITVNVAGIVAIYLLNHKRAAIADIERRYDMRVLIAGDDTLVPPDFRIDRVRGRDTPARIEPLAVIPAAAFIEPESDDAEIEAEVEEEAAETEDEPVHRHEDVEAQPVGAGAADNGGEGGRGKRRRRGGRRRRRDGAPGGPPQGNQQPRPHRPPAHQPQIDVAAVGAGEPDGNVDEGSRPAEEAVAGEPGTAASAEAERKRRRRGRRGGRRRRRRDDGTMAPGATPGEVQPQSQEPQVRHDSYEERPAQHSAPAVTPADIGAELWPHFDPEPEMREPSPSRAEKDQIARMDTHESRHEEPRREEPRPYEPPPAPVHVESPRTEQREPEPPMPPAPPPEAEAEPAPRKTGWWRRR